MWILRMAGGRQLAVPRLPAVVGSERGADVLLSHASVAARHARLSQGPEGTLRIEALDGAPLVTDGWPVESAELHPGREIVLGEVRISLARQEEEEEEEEEAVAAAPSTAASATPQTPQAAPGGVRARAATRPAAGARPDSDLRLRGKAILVTRPNERRGWLHTDLSQIAPGAKLLLALALLATAAAIVWALQALVGTFVGG